MRILVVQESDWTEVGPHQSHHLMERLSVRGHEIRVVDHEIRWKAHKRDGFISRRQVIQNYHKAVEGGNVTVIRPPFIRAPILDYVSLAISHRNEIKRQIREFQPDVIVGFGILNANMAIRLARKHNIPFFYYIIDELHRLVPEKLLQAVARLVESQNMEAADMVISINEGLREYTIKMGADPARTEVIRAGVDLGAFNPDGREAIRANYGIRDDEFVLFFMGWLYEFSGLREVALALAEKGDTRIKLLILGKGDLWDTLQGIRRERGLEERIIMEPWVPYQEVPKYIMAADICILPAHKNDIMMNIVPIKVYEYMAAGKPVVATSLPGLMKEFGEANGVLYAASSDEVLDKALEVIENGDIGPEGKRARNFVKSLSWDELTDIFQQTLSRGMPGG
ncbi:glycosyltransferase family 4 protein [Methanoculleus sp.]|uniref:glycosyltransferase family 4 protein n=1 Tax=Methanoculleus sp. TaxID=90427 RepID=UPI0026303B3A|nr:glycosyltransferase family 4 protein [Methanoculleus sp.]MDI6867734.1 glycosyltransferase family 4 protein [Methanoculleus sp.]